MAYLDKFITQLSSKELNRLSMALILPLSSQQLCLLDLEKGWLLRLEPDYSMPQCDIRITVPFDPEGLVLYSSLLKCGMSLRERDGENLHHYRY